MNLKAGDIDVPDLRFESWPDPCQFSLELEVRCFESLNLLQSHVHALQIRAVGNVENKVFGKKPATSNLRARLEASHAPQGYT